LSFLVEKNIFEASHVTFFNRLDKHASVDIVWLIPMILAEYFEIWNIESNLNGYCLNCSESQSSAFFADPALY
jgi:hypothetical protein